MDIYAGEDCSKCLEFCELKDKVETTTQLENVAEYVGTLVNRGSVICYKGPREVVVRGVIERKCRPDVLLPDIGNLALLEVAEAIWPGARVPLAQE